MNPADITNCLDDGIWRQVSETHSGVAPRPALFLDRDGVIVEEVNYLHRAEEVVLIPGAAETIAEANRMGWPVIIVTNQAGIARGYYGWNDFAAVQDAVIAQLRSRQATVDGVFACPHHGEGIDSYRNAHHPDRKPQPGMLLRAASAMNLDLARSWIAGDKASDLLAGRNARLQGGVLVLTGYGREHLEAAQSLATAEFPVLVGDSIEDLPRLVWKSREC